MTLIADAPGVAPPATAAALAHIPGEPVWPVIGHTPAFLRDSLALHRRLGAQHGPVHRIHLFGQCRVALHGADALEAVLTDRDGLYSSAGGWALIEDLFAGGLLLQDGAAHARHRRILQAAFRAPAMADYLALMAGAVPPALAALPAERTFSGYRAMKALTLQLGASVFLGLAPADPRAAAMSRDLERLVSATVSPVRRPLPLTPMWWGLRARARLAAALSTLADERVDGPGGDFFSQMCRAAAEPGEGWRRSELIAQFIFLMMAAHDTTASALTAALWLIGAHPDWQAPMAEEAAGLPEVPDAAALARLVVTGRVLQEALRLVPPIAYVPRQTTAPVRIADIELPAGTPVGVLPALVHRDPALWSEPDHFDPDRFAPDRREDLRHRFAWAPFGGGVHKCIGMHFALQQATLVLVLLLRDRRVHLPCGADVRWQQVPIQQPRGGLPLRLSRA